MNTKDIGNYGEKCAAKYLEKNGYKIVERNYRTSFSEIDIIAVSGDVLCFVEVKTRSNVDYGLPCEAVNYRKRQKIIKGAMQYMSINNIKKAVRFDVVEVYIKPGGIFFCSKPAVNHIKNAFDGNGR